jgi:quercetin dioxygenase-like cupin family protein
MKQFRLVLLLFFIIIISVAAKKVLVSDVYDWEKIPIKKNASGEVRDFFSSPAQTLENFQIKAVTLYPGKALESHLVEKGTDELIIVKEGTSEISINEKPKVVGEGSLVVAFSGDKVSIKNSKNVNTVFYSICFNPYQSANKKEVTKRFAPIYVDWSKPVFTPSEIGGRRNFIQEPTSSLNELEIHVTTLKEGLASHSPHSHPDEEIIIMRYGVADMNINGKTYKGGPGSIFFLAGNDPHGLGNAGSGPCEYYAIRWLTDNIEPKK